MPSILQRRAGNSLAGQLANALADGGWRTRLRKEQLAPMGRIKLDPRTRAER